MGKREQGGADISRGFVRLLPALMIAAGLIFDLATPPRFTAVPLFAAAPLIAAPIFTWFGTLLAGIAAILGVTGLHFYNQTVSQITAFTELTTVITVAGLALLINRVVRLGSERLASARVIAEAVQRAVLPSPADRIGELRVAARYEAAQEDAFIGGDLFAVQDTPFGVRLVVGDVRGKGMQAVETVAVVIGAFREAAEQERSLEGVAARLERALMREGVRHNLDAAEGFTTAVLAEIPRGDGVVRVVNRGHPEPLLLYADGGVGILEPTQAALPLGMGLGIWPDRADTHGLPPGATLLLYTDGLSEARDANGVFYDPGRRLAGRLFAGPEDLLDALVDDVRRHTGSATTDDMALLAVGRPLEGSRSTAGSCP
ncbi:serine phosphatase RsbU (regulator of sigma subunit) [Streptomyces sp. SLBN-118]|uniref:PP2C family protein-serine/threonine phosphatase n=1 Tax=Streptomyces sp. SLBN-118 TaxID=2768454 RepID=UPI001152569E|nr:PP2C family protein-serine/threonine phosphatase [Streptomyces sp. SLBN-118]TQK45537.1 serine phosphatase RsbU (regulator of sigma subunit) [Streptomyces sp. SLBN-118]